MEIIKQIIAIGGGAMSKNSEKFPIERYVLEATGKVKPTVCFLSASKVDTDRSITHFITHSVISAVNDRILH